VLVPVIVERDGDDVYLVAGHRRLAAAREAGLKEIPITLQEAAGNGDRRDTVAAAENISRAQLNQVEEAAAVKRLLDSGMTEKGVKDTLGVSARWVTSRKQILEVGEGWHPFIAEGKVSAEELKTLVSLYKVSAPLGDELLRWTKSEQRYGGVRVDGWAVSQAATAAKGKFWPLGTRQVDWPKLKLEPEVEKKRKTLRTVSYGYEEEWRPDFKEADLDRFRAAGVLWESGERGYHSQSIVTDTELFREVLTEKIQKARPPKKSKAAGAGDEKSGKDESSIKADRKAKRDEIAGLQAQARDLNHKLGVNLLKGLGTVDPAGDDVSRWIVSALVDSERQQSYYTEPARVFSSTELGGRGLRYVLPDYQRQVEKGKAKKQVTEYDPAGDAGEKAAKWLAGARSAAERIGRLLVCVAAMEYSIDRVLPRSHRCPGTVIGDRKVLARIVKPHLPRGLEACGKKLEKAEGELAELMRR
jgi:ParB/RepB/Spo0J family partition protein